MIGSSRWLEDHRVDSQDVASVGSIQQLELNVPNVDTNEKAQQEFPYSPNVKKRETYLPRFKS